MCTVVAHITVIVMTNVLQFELGVWLIEQKHYVGKIWNIFENGDVIDKFFSHFQILDALFFLPHYNSLP